MQGGCRRRERVVRSSNSTRADGTRNRQVECVERSQRDRPKPNQHITSIERVPIFQRMHLKKAAPEIILPSRGRAAFQAGIKFAVATTACEQAAKFDHGQPANGCRGNATQEPVELIRSSLALVPLRECARIDVNWRV